MPKAAMFNARIEGIDTAPAFRDAFKSKRCLIPADGFFEWTISPADGKKDPWHIYLPGHAPFSFAGLWAHNSNLDITSCTIITEPACEPMKNLHEVILAQAYYDAWLDRATPKEYLKDILSHATASCSSTELAATSIRPSSTSNRMTTLPWSDR